MVSLAVMTAVSAIVMAGITQMMTTQGTIANRAEMHTSVRSATELMQQEIGQAGAVALVAPNTNISLAAAVATGTNVAFTLTPASAMNGVFVGELLSFDTGANLETITVTGTAAAPTATFSNAHAGGAPVVALGAFSSGIVPPSMANGSTGTKLKLYGDINSDGSMVYVEYSCDTAVVPGFLYRQQVAFNAAPAAKVNPPVASMALLTNVLQNPNDPAGNAVPCFTYQTRTVGTNDYVTDVAITMTVRTQIPDPKTRLYQNETKALLNISPRNVVNAWVLASHAFPNRVQPIPPTVTSLLP
jgi:hypothetical protein